MAIRRLVRLLMLGVLAFPFLICWGLYVVGSIKNRVAKEKQHKYSKTFDLRVGLLSQEEQYAK